MTNTVILKYLNKELDYLDKIQFEHELDNDLFLKDSIEGLLMWRENNKTQSLEELNKRLEEMIDNIIKTK